MKRLLTILACAAMLSACKGSNGGGPETGHLMEIGIEGVHYQTASQSGETDARGTYKYYPGETISFSLGDLQLARDIPAKPYLSPLDFFKDSRQALANPSTDSNGLLSQRPVVKLLAANGEVNNMMRFLLSLDQDQSVTNGDGIAITQRTIDQINAILPTLSAPIDFTDPNVLTPLETLLSQICFYPAGDYRCGPVPTQQQIDATTDPAEKQRLKDIVASIRHISDIDQQTAGNLLVTDTGNYDSSVAVQYYLLPDAISLPASDTAVKEAKLQKTNGSVTLDNIEAISLNDSSVAVKAYGTDTASFDYYVVGTAGDSATLLVAFKPTGDYRWFEKSLRVIVK